MPFALFSARGWVALKLPPLLGPPFACPVAIQFPAPVALRLVVVVDAEERPAVSAQHGVTIILLMPRRYPRLNPALEEAGPRYSPGATDASDVRGTDDVWEVLFDDGEWRDVTALAWWQDRAGRWVVQLEYHVSGEGTFTGMYLADPQRMREVPDEDE